MKLDNRYKLPKALYKGDLPPPQHYIRKTQQNTNLIETVEPSDKKTESSKKPTTGGSSKKRTSGIQEVNTTRKSSIKNSKRQLKYKLYEKISETNGQPKFKESTRIPVSQGGPGFVSAPLPDTLVVEVTMDFKIVDTPVIDLQIAQEYLTMDIKNHSIHPLHIYLPYPVDRDECSAEFDTVTRLLTINMPLDKICAKRWTEIDDVTDGGAPG